MSVEIIEPSEFEAKLLPAHRMIFNSFDYHISPFNPNIKNRALIENFSFGYDDENCMALKYACEVIGDVGIIVSAIFGYKHMTPADYEYGKYEDLPSDPPQHFIVRPPSIEKFLDYRQIQEALLDYSAIYSPSGQWGLMNTEFDYGLIGGNDMFMKAFFEALPPNRREPESIANIMLALISMDPQWYNSKEFVDQVVYIYGQEKAMEIFKIYGYPKINGTEDK